MNREYRRGLSTDPLGHLILPGSDHSAGFSNVKRDSSPKLHIDFLTLYAVYGEGMTATHALVMVPMLAFSHFVQITHKYLNGLCNSMTLLIDDLDMQCKMLNLYH